MSSKPGISVVIPLFNESAGIPQLKEKLLPIVDQISRRYPNEVVFVDDGSTDNTYENLARSFPGTEQFRIARHETNRNLGAAIRTGAGAARFDWLVFLDSDCTYAPPIILALVAELEKGCEFVTASPYHPQGQVEGVPAWRLFLSTTLSRIYRLILGQPIHTYTAMVRGMTRTAFQKSQSDKNDFSAVAEMILRAVKNGIGVREVPAVLRTRIFGVSKMRTLRMIRAHLYLILMLVISPAYFAHRENPPRPAH